MTTPSRLAIFGALAVGLVWLSAAYILNRPADEATLQPAEEGGPLEPRALRLEARWLLAGEVFWGRQMERMALAQSSPYEYLFSQLGTLNREDYDAWLAHLECPVTDADIPFATQASSLIFNCRPEYLEEFEEWFNAVSLANNHTDNVNGVEGLKETRANLEAAGVQYYGHFDNAVRDDICEIVALPARLMFDDGSVQNRQLPVALCGYHNVFRQPTDAELDEIKRYAGRFLTIASPQQGAEYQPAADELKRQVYRSMIDRGADLVVASHPHWVQDSEVYKGKLILYSVGNFMFDQEWSDEVKRGAALDLKLDISYSQPLAAWLDLDCAGFKDDCRQSAESAGLVKPDFKFEFDLISVIHEGGRTRRASEAVHQLNLKRTNWPDTVKKLKSL